MKSYNIITLDGERVLNQFKKDKKGQILFRFNSVQLNSVIKSQEARYENALYEQLINVLEQKSAESKKQIDRDNKDLLKEHIIYIDFKSVFQNRSDDKAVNKALEERLQSLFYKYNNGEDVSPKCRIEICFNNHSNIYTEFLPFDKSNSMAKRCIISFISKDLKDDLDKRLCLDIDFSGISLISSKYYAYRGLYLSAGYRIESGVIGTDKNTSCIDNQKKGLIFDEQSVIVINNHDVKISESFYTASVSKTDDELNWEFPSSGDGKKDTIYINPFDGEGIICPDYISLINQQLEKYGFHKKSHSIQVRLPFMKGMLHEVDFNKFFTKEIGVPASSPIIIEDAFGISRDLRKAKIIITTSMLKCWKWLKLSDEVKKWDKEKNKTAHNHIDYMQYYFEKFNKYNHALYVTNSDALLHNDGTIKLNYQFLSTLKLVTDESDKLINDHISRLKNVYMDLLGLTAHKDAPEPEKGSDSEDSEDSQDEISCILNYDFANYFNALRKNNSLIHDLKIKGYVDGYINTLIKGLTTGKFTVSGEHRFLSGDLFCFLIELVKLSKNNSYNKSISDKLNVKYKTLIHQKMKKSFTYMPVKSRNSLTDVATIGMLRNPHLSRNEQCLFKCHDDSSDKYDYYFHSFRHLTGIAMTPYGSSAPLILGGADFDGDIVSVIYDTTIVNAIARGVYGNSKDPEKRILSVVQIPTTKSDEGKDPGGIPYNTINDTFTSQVGLISNMAVCFAEQEYQTTDNGQNDSKKEETKAEKELPFENACERCTIITGLEIDAAKNGKHPSANIRKLKRLDQKYFKQSSDIKKFVELKTWMKNHSWNPAVTRISKNTHPTSQYILKLTGKSIQVNLYPQGSDQFILCRLPGEYARFVYDSTKKGKLEIPRNIKVEKNKYYFTFESEDSWKTWKKEAKQKDSFKKIKDLVDVYSFLISRRRSFDRFIKDNGTSKYMGRIHRILQLQYDEPYLLAPLPTGNKKDTVESALLSTFIMLEEYLKDKIVAERNEIINRISSEQWIYQSKENREKKFCTILGLNKKDLKKWRLTIKLISNFSQQGFMLLYYVIREVIRMINDQTSEETFVASTEEPISENRIKQLEKLFPTMFEIYKKCSSDKTATKDLIQQLNKEAYDQLMAIAKKDVELALLSAFDKLEIYLNGKTVTERNEIINRITSEQWISQSKEDRERYFCTILGLNEKGLKEWQSTIKLISNFSQPGFMLLYYFIREIIRMMNDQTSEDTFIASTGEPISEDRIIQLDERFPLIFETYKENLSDKTATKDLIQQLNKEAYDLLMTIKKKDVRLALLSAFDKLEIDLKDKTVTERNEIINRITSEQWISQSKELALKYTVIIGNSYKVRDFIWSVFPDELMSRLCTYTASILNPLE